MTKIVTATAVLRLVDRGVLDLDEPIVHRVPSIATLQPTSAAGRVTARHPLTHSAGLPNRYRCGGSIPPTASSRMLVILGGLGCAVRQRRSHQLSYVEPELQTMGWHKAINLDHSRG